MNTYVAQDGSPFRNGIAFFLTTDSYFGCEAGLFMHFYNEDEMWSKYQCSYPEVQVKRDLNNTSTTKFGRPSKDAIYCLKKLLDGTIQLQVYEGSDLILDWVFPDPKKHHEDIYKALVEGL